MDCLFRAVQAMKTLGNAAKVERFGYLDLRHTVVKYLNDPQKVNLKKV